GLTSQHINNTTPPLCPTGAFEKVCLPTFLTLMNKAIELSMEWSYVRLLPRKHGHAASPRRIGKQILVFVVRLQDQLRLLNNIPFAAKFGGATGNFNAHKIAYPQNDWRLFGENFVEGVLSLKHSFPTTQIEHYDHFAAFFDGLKRINNIIIDLDRDIW